MIRKGRGRKTPYYHTHRDWENNLAKIRVEENFTIVQLCKEAKTVPTLYSCLQNGMISPLYLCGHKENTMKPWVARILKVLGCSFEDAFPRYVCDLSRADLVYAQAVDVICSEYSRNHPLNWLELRKKFKICLYKLPRRTRLAIFMRFYEDKTFEEIGEILNLSKQGVNFVVEKGLRKMRHPAMIQILLQ